MTNKLLLIAAFIFFTATSFGTTTMVMVQNDVFSPSSFTMHLGDTVMFMWSNGTHTTTSTSVPVGAATWDNPMDATHTTFRYIPSQPGVYHYQCSFHFSMGMTGTFTVTLPTSVQSASNPLFTIAPNPASSVLKLHMNDLGPVSISIINIAGRQISTNTYSGVSDAEIGVSDLANGIYMIQARQGKDVFNEKLIIAR